MEDRKEEIKQYLAQNVTPLIEPMLKKIAQQKPTDVLAWINHWTSMKIQERSKDQCSSGSQSEEENQELTRKIEELKKKSKKKNSRQAISAECFGIFNKKSDFVPRVLFKSSETQQTLRKLLKTTVLFRALQSDDLSTVIEALEEFPTKSGQTIIKEGDEGDMLFIVLSGEYECSKIINGQEKYLKTYVCGEAFGQLALMYNSPRQASIRCVESGVLYGLDRSTFTNIVQEAAKKRRKHVNECISKVGVFTDIEPYEKQQLCDALKAEQFEAGEYVVRQGDSGDKFYLIAEGNLIAEKQETPNSPMKKVFEYKVSDYFGEIALIKNTVRQASIKTMTKCKLMSIDRDSFKRLLGPIEDILMRNMDRYKKYMDQ